MKKTATVLTGLALAGTLMLAGCGRTNTPTDNTSASGSAGGSNSSASLIVGTTDKVVTIDPAGSYDAGSLQVEVQIYQFLYSFVPGSNVPTPDAAQSCSFTQPTQFTCTLKPGLKFANGDPLDSAAVKFSFDRQLAINDPNGPASLLGNLASTDAPDATTVVFNLKQPNDQTFEQVLATSAGPIVDPKIMSATALTPDADIVKGNGFSGPFTITSYSLNQSIVFAPNPGYQGNMTPVANGGVTMQYYTSDTNLQLAITNGDVDVAYRSLTPTELTSLKSNSDVTVLQAKGGEIRYMVFNMNTMPDGSTSYTDAQKLAIRQSIASSVDRQALSDTIYQGLYTPLCSYIPDGYVGANTAVCDQYPLDATAAAKFLSDAGVSTPVTLNIQYNPDHYGSSSAAEYALIQTQLQSTGLFKVNLQSTEWVTYNQQRVQDAYPIYQLGWFPDYPDADDYLTPFFGPDSFVGNHYNNAQVQADLVQEVGQTDAATRTTEIQNIQNEVAKDLPTLPLLQGSQQAVYRNNVAGVSLGVSQNLFLAPLSKS